MSGEQDFSRVAGRVNSTAGRVNSNGIQKQHGESSVAQQPNKPVLVAQHPNKSTAVAQKRKLDSDSGIYMTFIYI